MGIDVVAYLHFAEPPADLLHRLRQWNVTMAAKLGRRLEHGQHLGDPVSPAAALYPPRDGLPGCLVPIELVPGGGDRLAAPGYWRGDWRAYSLAIRWLHTHVPEATVHYGGDVFESLPPAFTPEDRESYDDEFVRAPPRTGSLRSTWGPDNYGSPPPSCDRCYDVEAHVHQGVIKPAAGCTEAHCLSCAKRWRRDAQGAWVEEG